MIPEQLKQWLVSVLWRPSYVLCVVVCQVVAIAALFSPRQFGGLSPLGPQNRFSFEGGGGGGATDLSWATPSALPAGPLAQNK